MKKTVEKTPQDMTARLTEATDRAVDTVLSALRDEKQFYRYVVTDRPSSGVAETVEKEFGKLDTGALKELTVILKELTALQRSVRELAADEPPRPGEVRVVIPPEAEAWGE